MNVPEHSTSVVIVFLKAPQPGRVKTRLAATIGVEDATGIYRILAESQLRRIPDEFVREVRFAPVDAEREMREWLGDAVDLVPQSSGDLGERLARAFDDRCASHHTPVLAIGADCPTLDADTLRQAADALRTTDVVLGPAKDGGYYLIGLKQPQPRLFDAIPWSSAGVLEATLDRARSCGLSVQLLKEMEDIDDEESLRRCIAGALESRVRAKTTVIHV